MAQLEAPEHLSTVSTNRSSAPQLTPLAAHVTSRSGTQAHLPFVRVGGRVPGVHSGGGAQTIMADDGAYFTRRAIEEGKFAAAAASVAARARHEQLALLYWSLANGAVAARLPIIADAVIRPGDIAL